MLYNRIAPTNDLMLLLNYFYYAKSLGFLFHQTVDGKRPYLFLKELSVLKINIWGLGSGGAHLYSSTQETERGR